MKIIETVIEVPGEITSDTLREIADKMDQIAAEKFFINGWEGEDGVWISISREESEAEVVARLEEEIKQKEIRKQYEEQMRLEIEHILSKNPGVTYSKTIPKQNESFHGTIARSLNDNREALAESMTMTPVIGYFIDELGNVIDVNKLKK